MNYSSAASLAMEVEEVEEELLEAEPLTVGLQLTGGATSAAQGTLLVACRCRLVLA
jgi:hypothetical protein